MPLGKVSGIVGEIESGEVARSVTGVFDFNPVGLVPVFIRDRPGVLGDELIEAKVCWLVDVNGHGFGSGSARAGGSESVGSCDDRGDPEVADSICSERQDITNILTDGKCGDFRSNVPRECGAVAACNSDRFPSEGV